MTEYPLTVTRDIESMPGGWSYTVPETGITLKAPFAKILRGRIKAHMAANGLPIPDDFDAWVDNEICGQGCYGYPFCGKTTPKPIAGMPLLSLSKVARFLSTMMQVVKDRKFVSRAEAERRRDICLACPLATSVGGCKGCSAVFAEMGRLLKKNPIKMPEEKSICHACGCLLELKVLIPNPTLDKAEGESRPPYAEGCWRHQG